jgi:hypothetical protein
MVINGSIFKNLTMSRSIFTLLILFAIQAKAQTINIVGPAGSGQFGTTVTVLSNGNYVVSDPLYDDGAVTDVGAVYLYNGSTHALISTLKGSTAGDNIGSNGVTALSSGNFLVVSPKWDNGAVANAGAVTWVNGITGVSGTVGITNSLVGSTVDDRIGSINLINSGIMLLGNGNYLVFSPNWDNGAVVDAGAITWANGNTGITGTLNSSNSLVGTSSSSRLGLGGIKILPNGNYVIYSSEMGISAGAVTWANGNTGITGVVSSSNSLFGKANDRIGSSGITVLSNGNYLVGSSYWDNGAASDAGAVTWCNGSTGLTGEVNSSNSLVGTKAGDNVGNTVTALTNGNYVVGSPNWDNVAIVDAGAATWCNGVTGLIDVVSSSNSLVGSTAGDKVGGTDYMGIAGTAITALSNGNYVVCSPWWDNGIIQNVGAITWCNGNTGKTGTISNSNSLVGGTKDDWTGLNYFTPMNPDYWWPGIFALTNGNYVIISAYWDNGAIVDAGAATWCNGSTGTTGVISSSNSLVGSTKWDFQPTNVIRLANGNCIIKPLGFTYGSSSHVGASTWVNGNIGIHGAINTSNSLIPGGAETALSNGNYVIRAPGWNGGRGAVTWVDGAIGITTTGYNVNNSNSLVGNTPGDIIGSGIATYLAGGITTLENGNYLVVSPYWNTGTATRVGAVTICNGTTGTTGIVNAGNSLVGSKSNDSLGIGLQIFLGPENFAVISPYFDNGIVTNAGAVSWSNGANNLSGIVTSCNSVLGTTASGGSSMNAAYNTIYDYLIAGRPADNLISIFNLTAMSLAVAQDSITQNIYNTAPTPLIANSGCRIIATLAAGGINPVNSGVDAKVWVEPFVPVYGDDPFVARHYQITPVINGPTSTGRITLYFTQQEFDDFNAHPGSILDLPANAADATGIANLRVGKYYGTSSNGSGLPATYTGNPIIINPDDADIVWNSTLNRWEVTFDTPGFSGFVIQTKTTSLPLQLLNFSAALSQSDVLLNWTTTNEINTQNFEVERSTDGRNFIAVGSVAAINTTTDHTYNYTDAGATLLSATKLYYRLKLVDNDSRYNHSKVVLLQLSKNNTVIVYPNPVNNITTISFSDKTLLNTAAVLNDMQGKKVQQFLIRNYQQQIDMSRLSKGMYLLKLEDGTAVKLIKN